MSQLSVAQGPRHTQPVWNHPLATVVIVCYNQARYLPEAIESALNQTYSPLEVLVIDDGSADETAAVAHSFPAVRYIYQVNRGLGAARNAGLHFSLGEYIVFLDADDKLLPNAIEAGFDCFQEAPQAAFVYGSFRNITSDGSPGAPPDRQIVEKNHYRRLLEGNFIGMHGTVLYRRGALEVFQGFDERLPACEDYDLYLRIARDSVIRGHRELVAEYRRHDSNMSRDHAFMLKHVLRVLHQERTRLPNAGYRKSLRTGVRVWKDYYGTLLLEQWKQAPSWRGLLTVVRWWPRGVVKRGLARFAQSVPFSRRRIRFGSFGNRTPVSMQFGFDRGLPVDRYYIEAFLASHADCIRGHVLEVGDDAYSRRFGAAAITRQDILHVVPGFRGATIIADLASAPHLPSNTFDCVVLTQTLHYIFDLEGAVATLHRILKPGGMALVTLPGISKICRDQDDTESDCWRFTTASARKLFSIPFGPDSVRVRTYGNVKTAIAFLAGLAAEDLQPVDLEEHDPDYQVIVAVSARKREEV
jgi:glycosyltransferase involved in cell wall biosynthesis